MLAFNQPASAQDGDPWYQVELGIFTHQEEGGTWAELFTPAQLDLAYPARLRRLDAYVDLLAVTSWAPPPEDPNLTPEQRWLLATGPQPRMSNVRFLLPDLERSPYLQLPATVSDFQQTFRALELSTDHRLLYRALWRQPMTPANRATSLLIQAGSVIGDHHELEGSVTFRFNTARDRVVVDVNLWLSQFGPGPEDPNWALPDLPERVQLTPSEADAGQDAVTDLHPRQVVQLRASREMRSQEFHYIDHPRLGMVVSVKPYEVPPFVPRDQPPANLLPAATAPENPAGSAASAR